MSSEEKPDFGKSSELTRQLRMRQLRCAVVIGVLLLSFNLLRCAAEAVESIQIITPNDGARIRLGETQVVVQYTVEGSNRAVVVYPSNPSVVYHPRMYTGSQRGCCGVGKQVG